MTSKKSNGRSNPSKGALERPLIFLYDDYRVFLSDMYRYLKEKNRSFSHRAFAKRAGIKSFNYLKLVMDGDRNLSFKMIPAFCKGLQLNRDESHFFHLLVQLNHANSPSERAQIFEQLSRSKKYREIKELEVEQYEYFSKWYYSAVRELVSLPGSQSSPEWIAINLRPAISEKEAADALSLLERLNLIEKDSGGRWRPKEMNVVSSPKVRSVALFSFHQQMIDRARHALEVLPREERDISSVTIPLAAEDLEKLRSRITRFRSQLLAEYESSDRSNSVFQVNIQIFPLSVKLEV